MSAICSVQPIDDLRTSISTGGVAGAVVGGAAADAAVADAVAAAQDKIMKHAILSTRPRDLNRTSYTHAAHEGYGTNTPCTVCAVTFCDVAICPKLCACLGACETLWAETRAHAHTHDEGTCVRPLARSRSRPSQRCNCG